MSPMLGLGRTLLKSSGFRAAWTPAALGGSLALWLDANDASTITLNGSTVSQWRDKSGNARHASQGTEALQPAYNATGTNGLPRIEFNNNELTLPEGIYNNNPAVCLVMNRGTNLEVSLRLQNTTEVIFVYNFDNRGWVSRRGQAQNPYTQLARAPVSDIYVHDSGSSSGITWSHIINGTAVGTSENIGNSGGTSNANVIGRNALAHNYLVGSFNEIIVLPGNIESTIRQRLEGYLAWKWGLVANLPANHPYKNSPPYA